MTLRQIKKNIRQAIKDLEANDEGHDWPHLGRIQSKGILKEAIAAINFGIKMDKEIHNKTNINQ